MYPFKAVWLGATSASIRRGRAAYYGTAVSTPPDLPRRADNLVVGTCGISAGRSAPALMYRASPVTKVEL
jgi:hypothetical protein